MPPQDSKDKCSKCLQQLGSDTYLSNCTFSRIVADTSNCTLTTFLAVFTTILAGCQDQTRLKITLDGSLFNTNYVNVTTPTSASPATPQTDQGPLSLGTKIGIAIAAICVLLALTGFTIICIGKRRRRAKLAARARQTDAYVGARIQQVPRVDTKWAPQASLDESPLSASGYGTDRHFSPYSSKYSSPVSARDAQPVQMWEWPLQGAGGGGAGQMQDGGGWEMAEREREVERMRAEEESRMREEWAMEAASRGFTVAPVLGVPPPPPTRAKT